MISFYEGKEKKKFEIVIQKKSEIYILCKKNFLLIKMEKFTICCLSLTKFILKSK